MTEIPKVIHYCWFGHGAMPSVAHECIKSWKQFLPDHEIRLWDESNFPVDFCTYTAEAYQARKFAFVSDVARFWILHRYGGIYFDTDVKVLAPMDHILRQGPFMGTETNGNENGYSWARVAPGLGMAATPGMPLLHTLLSRYLTYRFISPLDGSLNLRTIVEYTTSELHSQGLPHLITEPTDCAGFRIYPKEYFSPRSMDGRSTVITPNTCSIHLFTNTWGSSSLGKKLRTRAKELIMDRLLPASAVTARLDKNRARRDLYFAENFVIK